MNELGRILAELVAIESVSSRPNGQMIDFLARLTEAMGFSTRRFEYVDESGVPKVNLVAATSFDAPPALALVGHTDTVPFDVCWARALTLEESDGRLVGRGACDTKGFIACALVAAARVDRSSLKVPLAFVFTADEEVGCVGAKKLVEQKAIAPRFAIVGEPTSLTPIRAHKGYCRAEIEIRGREAHSAHPHLGRSAILAGAQLISEIETLSRELESQRHPDFEPAHTTVNVGMIHGGQAPNMVAGACRFTLEWRPVPGAVPGHVLERVRELAGGIGRARDVEIAIVPQRADPALESTPSSPIVSFLEEATGKPSATASYGTEAPQLSELGAEVCVFGPGDIRVAHQTGEYVPVADLERCAEVLASAILRFCG